MSNRIRTTRFQIYRLTPTEAEVGITAELDFVSPRTELRGKLVGPRCPGVSTIEIAYAFHPLPSETNSTTKTLTARVVIPEPNLWTEAIPYIYEGWLELWHDGHICDTTKVAVGLKLGPSAATAG